LPSIAIIAARIQLAWQLMAKTPAKDNLRHLPALLPVATGGRLAAPTSLREATMASTGGPAQPPVARLTAAAPLFENNK
jgi:hypothetical protein